MALQRAAVRHAFSCTRHGALPPHCPELFLKRALVGGLERVFEINRNFRNEGVDSTHSPEYVALEFYAAYTDYRDVARITREIIQEAAIATTGGSRSPMRTAASTTCRASGPRSTSTDRCPPPLAARSRRRRRLMNSPGCAARWRSSPRPTGVAGKYVEELLDHYVIPTLDRPTFVMDYPEDTSPLTRAHPGRPGVVEKWDLYIDGYEQGTGYSELADPVIQREAAGRPGSSRRSR